MVLAPSQTVGRPDALGFAMVLAWLLGETLGWPQLVGAVRLYRIDDT